MTTKEAILYSLRFSRNMVGMWTRDLSREDMHYRIVPQANCAAWILGHLILSDRYLLKLVGVPAEAMPALPDDAFEQRFSQDDAAPQAQDFGDVENLPGVFDTHRHAVIQAVEAADDSLFDQPLDKPLRIARTVGEFLLFAPNHGAMHMGQISAIRRSLGRPPLV